MNLNRKIKVVAACVMKELGDEVKFIKSGWKGFAYKINILSKNMMWVKVFTKSIKFLLSECTINLELENYNKLK